eukprot:jgi/Psemu1/325767/estExt_fgenesh1_pg.C_2820013
MTGACPYGTDMNDAEVDLLLEDNAAANRPGRFYDGNAWVTVVPEKIEPPEGTEKREKRLTSVRGSTSSSLLDDTPVPPVLDGDGKILVTIPSFRDGQHCGNALEELFNNAADPDNIVVSLIEQQHEDDPSCLEVYCVAMGGVEIIKRKTVQGNSITLFSNDVAKKKCPRFNQIRVVRVQDNFAKGPPWSRVLGRRSLGNEEFCLQTAAHSSFVEHWDEKVRKEWILANNEFGIISNPPKPKDEPNPEEVPRTCSVDFLEEEELPHYSSLPEGKVENLEEPLLAHTWSPGFSFSKCHLEEAAPADGFLPYVSSNIEAFARYARFWTRGYDVYTPTQNIVYRQSGAPNPSKLEWINLWAGRKSIIRDKSLQRIRSYLEIDQNTDDDEDGVPDKLDNLGIYGIGKRRTLEQMNEFVGIDLDEGESRSADAPCGNFKWVPYNSEISPMENLKSNPNDLDPQPEYPMRTNLTFEISYARSARVTDFDALGEDPIMSSMKKYTSSGNSQSEELPLGTIFILWFLGLVIWCYVYVILPPNRPKKRKKRRKDTKNK